MEIRADMFLVSIIHRYLIAPSVIAELEIQLFER